MIHHLIELFALFKMGGFAAPEVDNFTLRFLFFARRSSVPAVSSQGLRQVLRAEVEGTEGETPPRCLGGRSMKSHRRRRRFSPKTGSFARAQVSQSVRLIEEKTLIPLVRLLGTFFRRILSGKVMEKVHSRRAGKDRGR